MVAKYDYMADHIVAQIGFLDAEVRVLHDRLDLLHFSGEEAV